MKILLVAMCDSVHTARWIGQFEGQEVYFQLFPSTPNRRIHPRIADQMGKRSSSFVRLALTDRLLALPLGVLDLVLGNRLRSYRLARLIKSESWDAIHLLETQHAGYLFHATARRVESLPPVALSLWGSDLVWFGKFDSHRQKIFALLRHVDLIFLECRRDIALATDLGFTGRFTPPLPASGGISDVEGWSPSTPPSERQAIVVKGYTGFVGKADVAMRVIKDLKEVILERPIHFYSASFVMTLRLKYMRLRSGLDLHVHRKKSLSHEQVLELFRSARVSLSLSLSDGLPGSMREAAWTGAFPIESAGSCVCEWTEDGAGVLLVDPQHPSEVANALVRALTDDDLVDRAASVNTHLIHQLDSKAVSTAALEQYRLLIHP
jgi:glycosyltransferase involved in cell wall biosynthesis